MSNAYKFIVEHYGNEITVDAFFGSSGGSITAYDDNGNIISARSVMGDMLSANEKIELVFEAGLCAGLALR